VPIKFISSVNKLSVVGKFFITIIIIIIIMLVFTFLLSSLKIILFPNIVNQCVRKPVRESALSNTTPGNCLIHRLKNNIGKTVYAACTVLLLCTCDQLLPERKRITSYSLLMHINSENAHNVTQNCVNPKEFQWQ
jgi:hypothetical protein